MPIDIINRPVGQSDRSKIIFILIFFAKTFLVFQAFMYCDLKCSGPIVNAILSCDK